MTDSAAVTREDAGKKVPVGKLAVVGVGFLARPAAERVGA